MSRRSMPILVALTMVLVACGGDSGDSEPQLTTTSTAAEPSETDSDSSTPTTTAPAPQEKAATAEEGTGTATIGDMTWEFTTSGGSFAPMCDLDVNDAGLIFTVLMFGTDDTGREIALNISGPLSGDDGLLIQAGSATLEFERWTADPSVYDRPGIEGLPEGVGATVQIDGNTVSGSGVFYDDTALRNAGSPYDAGVLAGTFSATCPSS